MIEEPVEAADDYYDISDGSFREQIKRQAVECMDLYFCDKKYWAGGKIPKSKLFNETNILMVMQTNIIDAFDVAYTVLAEKKPQSFQVLKSQNLPTSTAKKGWEVLLCYEALKQCGKRSIPKCFAGGMMLVYLSICEGVDCFETLKKYNAALHGKHKFAL